MTKLTATEQITNVEIDYISALEICSRPTPIKYVNYCDSGVDHLVTTYDLNVTDLNGFNYLPNYQDLLMAYRDYKIGQIIN